MPIPYKATLLKGFKNKKSQKKRAIATALKNVFQKSKEKIIKEETNPNKNKTIQPPSIFGSR